MRTNASMRLALLLLGFTIASAHGAAELMVGAAKVDVTPDQAIWLSG